MLTRRSFVSHAAAVPLLTSPLRLTTRSNAASDMPGQADLTSEVHHNAVIAGVVRSEDTVVRLGGWGRDWCMTWSSDDKQIVSLCDGVDWSATPKQMYNTRLFRITGGPDGATFDDIPSYPNLPIIPGAADEYRYYGYGNLAVDGHIYQFLSTLNHLPYDPRVGLSRPWPGSHFIGAKLIYSPDHGRSWHNQDGSTPVVWEHWQKRSRKNMVFYEEPGGAFSELTVLQMGRNYEANRDGYVYVYAPESSAGVTSTKLTMFRVQKGEILNRNAYEYFAGVNKDGEPIWSTDIQSRAATCLLAHSSECPSVTYNAPLGVYLMANSAIAPELDKPSYLGIWAASKPWGPWVQIHEEKAWMPDNDANARAFSPQIAPKWIARDGKSFWLVWTDVQTKGSQGDIQRMLQDNNDIHDNGFLMRMLQNKRRVRPYYAFNAQRVDLLTT